jgi:hypothetical protein
LTYALFAPLSTETTWHGRTSRPQRYIRRACGYRSPVIYVGSNRGLVDTLPANCNGQSDLQTVMTHEWGHSYGLGHEMSGPDEVMYPSRPTCQAGLRRHLGEGDYDGMSAL